jgi:hypothetical protein
VRFGHLREFSVEGEVDSVPSLILRSHFAIIIDGEGCGHADEDNEEFKGNL